MPAMSYLTMCYPLKCCFTAWLIHKCFITILTYVSSKEEDVCVSGIWLQECFVSGLPSVWCAFMIVTFVSICYSAYCTCIDLLQSDYHTRIQFRQSDIICGYRWLTLYTYSITLLMITPALVMVRLNPICKSRITIKWYNPSLDMCLLRQLLHLIIYLYIKIISWQFFTLKLWWCHIVMFTFSVASVALIGHVCDVSMTSPFLTPTYWKNYIMLYSRKIMWYPNY